MRKIILKIGVGFFPHFSLFLSFVLFCFEYVSLKALFVLLYFYFVFCFSANFFFFFEFFILSNVYLEGQSCVTYCVYIILLHFEFVVMKTCMLIVFLNKDQVNKNDSIITLVFSSSVK